MDRVDNENTAPVKDSEVIKAENAKKMEEQRVVFDKQDSTDEGLLLAVHGAKIKFNGHLGDFKVLTDVPTTQGKLTGTIVEKQIPNFTFNDGFQMISLTQWQDFGTVKVQENEVLLKKSFLPGVGKMPGNVPPETGKIEFVTSGQINVLESLNTKGAPIPEQKDEDRKCFCEKEFSVEGIKSFYKSKKLFTAKNCPLPEKEKTYEAFTNALNKAMKANNISTCLRKAHFLAQIEAETNFDTTLEYADGWDYDHSTHIDNYNKYLLYIKDTKKYPENGNSKIKRGYNRYLECLQHGHDTKGYGPKYKGRGLIQLTWKDTYEAYFLKLNKKELVETPNIVAHDINHVCNSAAWYWKERSAWGDLNKFADNDDFISICIGVNGGVNGFSHRKSNIKSILELMKVSENCKNLKIEKIGVYKYDTSAIRNTKWGKKENNKKAIQKYDD